MASRHISKRSMKDLGLYSAYDVAQWCIRHKISPIYIERRRERIMEVAWQYMETPSWIVRDGSRPGVEVKRMTMQGDETVLATKARARAWVEATYEIPMKFLPSMNAFFPAVAVDLLLDELATMIRVWGLDKDQLTPLSQDVVSRIKTEYPVPLKIRMKEYA